MPYVGLIAVFIHEKAKSRKLLNPPIPLHIHKRTRAGHLVGIQDLAGVELEDGGGNEVVAEGVGQGGKYDEAVVLRFPEDGRIGVQEGIEGIAGHDHDRVLKGHELAGVGGVDESAGRERRIRYFVVQPAHLGENAVGEDVIETGGHGDPAAGISKTVVGTEPGELALPAGVAEVAGKAEAGGYIVFVQSTQQLNIIGLEVEAVS